LNIGSGTATFLESLLSGTPRAEFATLSAITSELRASERDEVMK
jgi:hypothetical protein